MKKYVWNYEVRSDGIQESKLLCLERHDSETLEDPGVDGKF